jgi:glycosyltransferase 2 family protein
VNRLKKLLPAIGSILTVLSLVYLAIKLFGNFKSIPPFANGIEVFVVLIASSIVSSASFVLLAVGWSILLKGGGIQLPLVESFGIMGKAQIGKYLPGNVFHYVQRASLGAAFGITPEVSALSMGVEALLFPVCALIIVFTSLFFGQTNILRIEDLIGDRTISIAVAAGIVLAGTAALIANKKTRRWLYERRGYVDGKRAAMCLFLYGIFFIVMGLNNYFLVHFIWQKELPLQWYEYTWGFTAAWLLGYIVPGAPGGIGIREAAVLAIYGPVMGDGMAASLAILWRLIATISDLMTFLAAFLISKVRLNTSR